MIKTKNFKNLLTIDKKLFINISSLFSINFIRFALNIITLPHLINIYGIQNWGKIVIFQILINYFIWLTDWSLDQHSAKLISIHENNKNEQSKIFSASLSAQFILLILALIVFNFIGIFNEVNKEIYLFSNLIIIGNFLQPHWYLTGREKLHQSAFIMLTNKLIFSFFILFILKVNANIEEYFLYQGISSVVSGILIISIIKINYNENFIIKDFKSGLLIIKKSFKLFISEIWGNFSNSLVPIIIISLIGEFELGIFNIADRIKSILIQAIHPITNSIFPRFSKKYNINKKDANKSFKKIIFYNSLIIVALYVFISINISPIVGYFNSDNRDSIISILRILLVLFVESVIFDQFIAYYFIPNNMYSFINNTKIIKFIFNVVLIIPFILNIGILGAAYSILISESLGLIIIIRKFCITQNI